MNFYSYIRVKVPHINYYNFISNYYCNQYINYYLLINHHNYYHQIHIHWYYYKHFLRKESLSLDLIIVSLLILLLPMGTNILFHQSGY